jgi:hypothetical protein
MLVLSVLDLAQPNVANFFILSILSVFDFSLVYAASIQMVEFRSKMAASFGQR